jgi:hypothetical protein
MTYLMVHYDVEEITVNVRKMFKKCYWTYLLIWRMYEIVMAATSNRTYHKVRDHSLPISICIYPA